MSTQKKTMGSTQRTSPHCNRESRDIDDIMMIPGWCPLPDGERGFFDAISLCDGDSKIHTVRVHPSQFQAILIGRRRLLYTQRINGCDVGDIIVLQEYDSDSEQYTKEMVAVVITDYMIGLYGCPDDACVVTFDLLRQPEPRYANE